MYFLFLLIFFFVEGSRTVGRGSLYLVSRGWAFPLFTLTLQNLCIGMGFCTPGTMHEFAKIVQAERRAERSSSYAEAQPSFEMESAKIVQLSHINADASKIIGKYKGRNQIRI